VTNSFPRRTLLVVRGIQKLIHHLRHHHELMQRLGLTPC